MRFWRFAARRRVSRELQTRIDQRQRFSPVARDLTPPVSLTVEGLIERWYLFGKRVLRIAATAASIGMIFAMPKIASGKYQIVPSNSPQGAGATFQAGASVTDLVVDDRVKSALDWLTKNTAWITNEQIEITEIPAPPFKEMERAAYLKKALAALGLRVRTDEVGNVIGELSGTSDKEIILITAHMDTVFPEGTDVRVRRERDLLYAPGISDNGAGLAALLGVARAMQESKIRNRRTVIFAADVGEEGEGNLRGIRKLVEQYGTKLSAVIALDGASTEYVVTQALASRRIEIALTGPGGHSWSDFGAPNPIDAMARGISRFLKTIELPGSPRTTFNIGEIEGGGSVNSIPSRAAIKVDIRSEQERDISRVESALRDAIRAGVQEEMAASNTSGMATADRPGIEMQLRLLGARPGGDLAAGSPLLQSVMDADRFLGNRSRTERSSTDANVPMSEGIPAISIGGGGNASGAHTLGEWYDRAGREMGLKRVLLTLLSAAGVEK
jgi:acetylornithine deacetylase/succinyl-diaminopimelate desuccinylase-like protein